MESEVALAAALELGQPGALDPALIEGLAEHAHDVRDGEGAEGLAKGQGAEVDVRHLPEGILGFVDGRRILVAPRKSRALMVLVILHELAHVMLREAGMRHEHSDVWRLALALAMPRRGLDRAPGDVAARHAVPWWAAKLRLQYLAEVFGNAA